MKIIAYEENGFVCLITPSSECELSVEQIAAKDVPPIVSFIEDSSSTEEEPVFEKQLVSRPYIIIDDSELPDRKLRELWRIVDSKVVVAE